MNAGNYKFCVEGALRVRAQNFDLEKALGAQDEDTYWLSHVLCTAARLSPLGLRGDAFRHWIAGLYRDGVYVHTDNYRVGVSIASDPIAKAMPGCQDSCRHGNPIPRLSNGARWVSLRHLSHWNSTDSGADVSEELRQRVLVTASAILREGANTILRHAWLLKGEMEAKAKERNDERETMLTAWEC